MVLFGIYAKPNKTKTFFRSLSLKTETTVSELLTAKGVLNDCTDQI
jgi:hypothetical protein